MNNSPNIPDLADAEALGLRLAQLLGDQGAAIEWDASPPSAQDAVTKDIALSDDLFAQPVGSRTLRVWRNYHALVVSRRFEMRDGFAEAAAQCPLPVLVRKSGGTAVVHGPHILNISLGLCLERAAPFAMEQIYAALGDVLTPALSSMGIEASLGDVDGAHCPGRYTVQVGGKKLAGTAAFVRQRGDKRVAMVHANLALDTLDGDLETIMALEAHIGHHEHYLPEAHTDLLREANRAAPKPQ